MVSLVDGVVMLSYFVIRVTVGGEDLKDATFQI